ncbi:MAG: YjbH domain-containing protein, partial [Aquificae bacterium]|nr:YjbH domain-containing protein [Aquificota bacterium]
YLKGKKVKILTLSLNYINSVYRNTFIGISAGYNEMMFAGVGGDLIYFIGDGKQAVGIGGDIARKRDYNVLFDLKGSKNFYDYYLSYYYSMDYPEININIKAGRFLAGDKGVRIQVSREVKGFEIGFWYTYSDTSDFTGDNRNYHDKGVFMTIPLRIFRLKDTPQTVSMSLSPWTRDVGQLVKRPLDLYKIVKRKSPYYIKLKAEEKE